MLALSGCAYGHKVHDWKQVSERQGKQIRTRLPHYEVMARKVDSFSAAVQVVQEHELKTPVTEGWSQTREWNEFRGGVLAAKILWVPLGVALCVVSFFSVCTMGEPQIVEARSETQLETRQRTDTTIVKVPTGGSMLTATLFQFEDSKPVFTTSIKLPASGQRTLSFRSWLPLMTGWDRARVVFTPGPKPAQDDGITRREAEVVFDVAAEERQLRARSDALVEQVGRLPPEVEETDLSEVAEKVSAFRGVAYAPFLEAVNTAWAEKSAQVAAYRQEQARLKREAEEREVREREAAGERVRSLSVDVGQAAARDDLDALERALDEQIDQYRKSKGVNP